MREIEVRLIELDYNLKTISGILQLRGEIPNVEIAEMYGVGVEEVPRATQRELGLVEKEIQTIRGVLACLN